MKIQADTSSTLNLIGAINSGAVSVGGKTVTGSFIITPTDPVCRWQIKDFGELTGTLLEDLFSSGREILLVGTGRVHHFPRGAPVADDCDATVRCRVHELAGSVQNLQHSCPGGARSQRRSHLALVTPSEGTLTRSGGSFRVIFSVNTSEDRPVVRSDVSRSATGSTLLPIGPSPR